MLMKRLTPANTLKRRDNVLGFMRSEKWVNGALFLPDLSGPEIGLISGWHPGLFTRGFHHFAHEFPTLMTQLRNIRRQDPLPPWRSSCTLLHSVSALDFLKFLRRFH